jgi:alpha-ketoglutarate-dependent 2,4-dichlorophenoxyacetate dioxygenase
MPLTVKRLGRTFFAEVHGIRLAAIDSDKLYAAILDALLEHGVLLFPGQNLSDAEQEKFSQWYGPLEVTFEDDRYFVAHLSNVDAAGGIRDKHSRKSTFLRANQQWHSDSTVFQAPARYSFLSAHAVPPKGGETQWADMRAAWDELPEQRRRELGGLILEHDFQNSRIKAGHKFDEEQRKRWPPLRHPLVRVHERTGRKALYVGSQATHVVGWPLDQGVALIDELIAYATQPRFVHTHRWSVGDLVIWDNQRVNHRGLPWDEDSYKRDLRRTTVKGSIPTMHGEQPVNEFEQAQLTEA